MAPLHPATLVRRNDPISVCALAGDVRLYVRRISVFVCATTVVRVRVPQA